MFRPPRDRAACRAARAGLELLALEIFAALINSQIGYVSLHISRSSGIVRGAEGGVGPADAGR